MKLEISSERFETDIVKAALTGVFATSTVFYYSIGTAFPAADVAPLGLAELAFSPQSWYFFSAGVTLCLGIDAVIKTAKYLSMYD